MQYRSVRRRSGIALYKNNFSAEDGQSKAEAIQNCPAPRFLNVFYPSALASRGGTRYSYRIDRNRDSTGEGEHMDTQEIRALLGKSIFERAQKYRKRILQSSYTTN